MIALDLFRRIGSWRAGDSPAARELERQLRALEDNISSMGLRLFALLMPRLRTHGDDRLSQNQIVAPGQFKVYDTRAAVDIVVVLEKPKASDAGTFIVLLDFAGGVGALSIRTPDSYINDAQVKLSTDYTRIIFCDGAGYWTTV